MEPSDDPIAVYRACVAPLYAYVARRAGGDRTLAEDVTQDAFLRLVAAHRAGRPPRPALPWLRAVGRNLLLDHYRRVKHRPASIDPGVLAALAEGRSTDAPAASAAAIAWAMSRLKPAWAALVDGFHLEGRSTADLAREHGLGARAVEGRLRRARAAMRTLLSNRPEDDHV